MKQFNLIYLKREIRSKGESGYLKKPAIGRQKEKKLKIIRVKN